MPLTEAPADAIAGIYAQSLFDLARDGGGQPLIEEVQGEIEEILDLARSDRRFGEFLASRIVAGDQRRDALRRIFEHRVTGLTLRFLLLLNEKGRLQHLVPIAAAFDRLVQEAFGRVEVDVYTAAPLAREELDMLRDRLRAALRREPILHPYTDNAMIGGVKLQIGDELIDASLATRLQRLRAQMSAAALAQIRVSADRLMEAGGPDSTIA